jgi:hypothetical protein
MKSSDLDHQEYLLYRGNELRLAKAQFMPHLEYRTQGELRLTGSS